MKRLLGFLVLLVLLIGCGCIGQKPEESGEKTIELSVDTLKTLTYTTITTPDPHLEATIEYGGVLLKDVLDAFNVKGAEEVKIVAKDGYTVVIRTEDLDLGILVAYMADGQEIPDDTGGPMKVIFSEEAQKVYGPENWVWWITKLETS